jgi:alpha-tubulin suppressor-like RCC1 family protein
MKTFNSFRSIRVLAVACLGFALRAHAGPEYTPNMVVETSAPGLARLEVMLSSKEWKEPRRFVFEGKDSITGGIALPEKYPAEYSITAYDAEGKTINGAKGPIPPVASLDKPLAIPLPSLEKGDGIVLSLNRERIALEVQKSEGNEVAVHAEVFDAAGNVARIDPEQLNWQLSDGRYLDLRRDFDPRDIHVVPHKGFEFQELCSLEPVVTLCRPNTQCKVIKVCSDPWVQISAGTGHTCGIKQSGAAFCWGENTDGQLGAPTTTSCSPNALSTGTKCSTRPLPVVCPAGSPCRFTQISAGVTLTVAVDINGDVWWWGRGLPTHHRVDAYLAGNRERFTQAAAGFGHGCALSQSRSEIWCWGANGYGETGVAPGPVAPATWEVPDYAPVRLLPASKFRKIVAGGETTCAIGSTSYDVVCWGRDDQHQVSGTSSSMLSWPGTAKFYFQQFGGLTPINDVSASGSGTCAALGWNNGVKCWGDHAFRNVAPFGQPDLIASGGLHVCAVTNQQAQCIGLNFWGEVGVGSLTPQNAVVNVNSPPASFASLSTGSSHTCGITPDGDAYCWGRNFEGQIGTGATSYTSWSPTKVTTP